MKLEDVPGAELEELALRLADLRHDLGKYIRFETRFALEQGDVEALRKALRADLLATRRRGDAMEAASAVWARMRPAELDDDPDVGAIDRAMGSLADADFAGSEPALRVIASLAAEVSDATRRLHERARRRVAEELARG